MGNSDRIELFCVLTDQSKADVHSDGPIVGNDVYPAGSLRSDNQCLRHAHHVFLFRWSEPVWPVCGDCINARNEREKYRANRNSTQGQIICNVRCRLVINCIFTAVYLFQFQSPQVPRVNLN